MFRGPGSAQDFIDLDWEITPKLDSSDTADKIRAAGCDVYDNSHGKVVSLEP